jgi:hypothetical protein
MNIFSLIDSECPICAMEVEFLKKRDPLLKIKYTGSLLLGFSVQSVSCIICMLTLLLMPLAGLYFCLGLDFVTPSL